ncbi:glycosyltransferase [Demequina lutea]|uniref:Glycosyltransferase involved in cell wall biosynthesis n=1 Tax=Demequina lutea TaxID=431489 RepID=A0A7Z0CJ55_9MICO|nr:glycosyltransferase [Demequina lutea]NYI40397.1 glycosyltransferase involved in cell wall biosynthesis [Demequina lutea]
MKIAQIVTYVSKNGAFGGPVSVAIAQSVELASRGHDVELLAGWDGVARIDAPGVNVRLFRTRRLLPAGFSGLTAPGLMAHLRTNYMFYDAVHVHLARDLITLPAASFLARHHAKYVVQSHGMVVPDSRIRGRVFDHVAVRRVLREAGSVIAYRGVDDKDLDAVSRGRANIEYLVNGVSIGLDDRVGDSSRNEVLFMARLHPRKRVMAFAEMALQLSDRGVASRFVVIGPDEGDLGELRAFISHHGLDDVLIYEGAVPYSQVRSRLSKSSVYVLPSVNEPFPVTVLEAMAVGTPCVITDSCGLAAYFRKDSSGLVTDGSAEGLAEAVERLLVDAAFRRSTIENADRTMERQFSISAVGDALEEIYRKESALR